MYPNSYYAATANPLPEQPPLGAQSVQADVCVIGAGFTEARRLWDLGEAAKNLVKDLIAELAIDCDLTPGVASVAHKPRYVAEYHALADKLATQYGRQGLEKIDARRTRELLGTDAYFGGYVDWDAAHLHPLNLALGVARRCLDLGVRIYENTPATAFVDRTSVSVRTSTGDVTADHLVLAANGHLG